MCYSMKSTLIVSIPNMPKNTSQAPQVEEHTHASERILILLCIVVTIKQYNHRVGADNDNSW